MGTSTQSDRNQHDVNVLAQVAQFLNSLDLDDLLNDTLRLLTDAVGAERGSFWLLDESGHATQRIITRRNLPPEHSRKVVSMVLSKGLAGWVYREQTATIVEDTEKDPRWVVFPDDKSPVRSVLCVPFVAKEHVNGIMTLEHAQPGFFKQEDVRLATTVANQATIAIRNAQLFDRVQTHQRQLSAVLLSTAEPLVSIDPLRTVLMINTAALDMLETTQDNAVGRPLGAISTKSFMAEVIQQLERGTSRFELYDPDTKLDYVVHVSSWREGETNDLGHVLVFNDITSIKELSRIKSQMLQMVSHDLKNPLGVILGYAEMMRMDLSETDEFYVYADNIARTTERILQMVSELLDLERIESGRADLGKLFDITDVLYQVCEEEEFNAIRKNQSFLTKIKPDIPEIAGDPALIREAFSNLIGNGLKYTPEGGIIIVSASANDGRFEFQVDDTGYGIPEALQSRLFERFYRAKAPGTEEIPGTGLGLSLVKAVVERHGGEIWYKSAVGEGSTFGFWLPLPQSALETQEDLDITETDLRT